jgi:hypothetical protein
MADVSYFAGRLLTSEDLRERFHKDPKATLEHEGLSLEDFDNLDLKVVIEPSGPVAGPGTTVCTENCTEVCSGGVGSISGSKLGTVTRLKTPTTGG